MVSYEIRALELLPEFDNTKSANPRGCSSGKAEIARIINMSSTSSQEFLIQRRRQFFPFSFLESHSFLPYLHGLSQLVQAENGVQSNPVEQKRFTLHTMGLSTPCYPSSRTVLAVAAACSRTTLLCGFIAAQERPKR